MPEHDATQAAESFVASPGAPAELVSGLTYAVGQANKLGRKNSFHLWVDNDIVGKSLVEPIYDGIEKSKFLVADITYLNLNVAYQKRTSRRLSPSA
jgi:hypothetical protein